MKKRELGAKGLFGLFFWRLASRYKDIVIQMGKVQVAKNYVQFVSAFRSMTVLAICSAFCIALIMTGIVFLHVAIILISGWTLKAAGLFLLVCGAVYTVIAAVLLLWIMSSKSWSKYFKVNEVTDKVLHD